MDYTIKSDALMRRALEAELLELISAQHVPKLLLEKELPSLQAAVTAAPTDVIALVKLGSALRLLDRLNEAKILLLEAKRLVSGPGSAVIDNLLGFTLCEQGYFDKALPIFDSAISLNPAYLEAQKNRELASLLLKKDGPTIENYARDYAFSNPEMAYLFKASLFDQKKYSEAWSFVRQSRQRSGSTDLGVEWQGENVRGKTILVVHEFMGLGDGFFNIRFVSLLAERGARVLVLAPPTVTDLFRSAPGVAAAASDVMQLPLYDLVAYMLDLPHFLGGNLDICPTPVPYLTAFTKDVAAWRERLGRVSGLKIGISYAGGVHNQRIAFHRHLRRHCPLACFAPLASLPGVTLINLQMGEETSQSVSAGVSLIDYTSDIRSYTDTAALIENLDLVITVDTSIAHCAGAIGKPVWILLQYGVAALWPTQGSAYPWYPSARLFHQREPGNWELTLAEVANDVGALLGKHDF